MKGFNLYLKQMKWFFVLAIACEVCFFVSFALFHLPLKAVLYPSILTVIAIILFFVFDFSKKQKKYKRLAENEISSLSLAKLLPNEDTIEDEAYQQAIEKLLAEIQSLNDNFEKKEAEATVYYTVWAHQIKTPISSMRVQLQNSESELCTPLNVELNKIEQYVEMVLTYLRLESESSDYLIKEYDVNEIVRQSVKKFASEFINRKIKLNYEKVSYKTITDEKWLMFVIEQILSNALKYNKENGFIEIKITNDCLVISDGGIGISSEDLPRIFERGFTGSNGRFDKRASGLGLYLCKRICDKLGHSLKVSSIVDEGTSVFIGLKREMLEKE